MKVFGLIILWIIVVDSCAYAQDSKAYYEQGLEAAQKGEADKALELLNKSIELKADEYVAWYNRAIVKTMLGHYEDALPDIEQTIRLNPGYAKAYLNRGTIKKHLTDYSGAMADYTYASQLDTGYGEAFYDRGVLYETFGKKELACQDYKMAKQLGFKVAVIKTEYCTDSSNNDEKVHAILWLKKTAASYKYAFTPDLAVMVGAGPEGGLANEKAYLELLRDAQGQPITYRQVGTCCGYKSDNAPKNLAMLDKYEITYTNDKSEQRSAIIYLSLYDYEEPLIPFGFKTVTHK